MEHDVPAESSPATEPTAPVVPPSELEKAVASSDDARFREIRHAQRAGKDIPPTAADPASAQPADQAAPTDAPPKTASEPVKPKHNAETRIRELAAENKDLKQRLERLERPAPAPVDVKPAESSPAKPKTDVDRYMEMSDAPKFEDFESIEKYSVAAAIHVYRAEQREREQQQHAKQKGDAFESMKSKGTDAFEDFDDVLRSADRAGLQWPEPIIQLVLTHERGHEIAYLLAKERIADPVKAGIAIAALLADTQAETTVSPVPPSPKAPPPATQLGSNTHDARDPIMTAVRTGDDGAFRAERLAKRVAQLRR